MDRMVRSELKARVTEMKSVYKHSDAMLAIYPGDGSRFARHIDNTTCDGRRLTAVVYLNPEWDEANGGALRIYPIDPVRLERCKIHSYGCSLQFHRSTRYHMLFSLIAGSHSAYMI